MTSYKLSNNKDNLIVSKPYSIFNIIKNKNGSAHYFFNGFTKIEGTNEIVINLIRANETFAEYQNIMYDGKRKHINFSDKYEFINFNDIKEYDIRTEISEAIRLQDLNGYDKMFKTENYYDNNYVERKKVVAVNSNIMDYSSNGSLINGNLNTMISQIMKEAKPANSEVNPYSLYVHRGMNKMVDKTGWYKMLYEDSTAMYISYLFKGDRINLPSLADKIYVNDKPIDMSIKDNLLTGVVDSASSDNNGTFNISNDTGSILSDGGFRVDNSIIGYTRPNAYFDNNQILHYDASNANIKFNDLRPNNNQPIIIKRHSTKRKTITLSPNPMIIL